MKTLPRIAALIAVFLFTSSLFTSSSTYADESLAACSKQKIRQMELTHKSATKTRSKKRSSPTSNRAKIEQIDEWLWKNCRSHAAEMRTIEQQYM